jgi:hypothetical protein
MKILKLMQFSILIGLILSSCSSDKDWHTANRESAGISPAPSITTDAVIDV